MAAHPIVGAWLVMSAGGPSLVVHSGDGTLHADSSPVGAASAGTWEPVGERGVHLTMVQINADANGARAGTLTIDGYPVVSEDGATFRHDRTQGRVTIRDAAREVVAVHAANGRGVVTGVRMRPGNPGFPDATPAAGTPTS